MLKEIIIAIQSYFQAHEFIKKHKLMKWILVPGILYAILFMISMYYFGHTANNFIEWLSLKTGLKTWLDKMNSGWLGFFFTIGSLTLWILMMLFYFSLFKYLFLIIGSPLFAYLSEKTEAIIEGKDFPFSFTQLAKDIFRGISIAGKNGITQTVYAIAILFACVIPVAGMITPILAVLIECYYYGYSMLDYSLKRHNKSIAESAVYISHHKGLAIGNGIVFYAMHLLPFVGWTLAPAYSVVAATLSIYPLKESSASN